MRVALVLEEYVWVPGVSRENMLPEASLETDDVVAFFFQLPQLSFCLSCKIRLTCVVLVSMFVAVVSDIGVVLVIKSVDGLGKSPDAWTAGVLFSALLAKLCKAFSPRGSPCFAIKSSQTFMASRIPASASLTAVASGLFGRGTWMRLWVSAVIMLAVRQI